MKAEAVVVGAGVDELVAAHYLALAGYAVTLVRERVGGVEDVLEPGWVPPGIVRALGLERHGLRIERPEPWAIVGEDGGLELGADMARSVEAIKKLSPSDALKWPDFCRRMHVLAGLLETLYLAPPPDPLAVSRRERLALARTGWRVRRLGRHGMDDLLRLLPMSAADFLDDWFESDVLKGVLGAGGVMHLAQGPRSGGTAFNLLHHHVGSAQGVFRPALSNMRAALSRRDGVSVRTESVARIDVREGRAVGVTLETGDELRASIVVSGLAPARTLLELVDAAWLDPEFVRSVRNVRSRGAAAAISLVLDRDPPFTRRIVAPSLDYLERAFDPVKYGRSSPQPYLEATSLGAEAPGRFRVQLHVQYVPHTPTDGAWDRARAEMLGQAAVARLAEDVPGFASWVIGQQVLTPDDLAHSHGFPQGQQYHAELALDQILWMRPTPQLAQYRTPLDGLYLCGPAMHPGAGIAGAAGANAAAVILRENARS